MTTTFNPAMVTLARESRRLTQTELATMVGVPQSAISKIESGAQPLSESVARTLSTVLNYPVSFFTQTDPVYPFGSSTFYHRKQQSIPTNVLRSIEAKVNIYRMHVVRLIRATDLASRCQFRRFDPEECADRVEEIAGLMRAYWRLPNGPIQNLISVMENAGAIVIRFNFGTAKMFGLSEWIPPNPPLFFLNDNAEISADRDRFTLAHELGHVLLHSVPDPAMEKQADRFAAEFLMPSEDIRSHLVPPIKLSTVARLKPYWKVAMGALIRRALDLGIINENQFTYLRIQMQEKGYRLREPRELDIEREQPSLLSEIFRAHTRELGFDYTELADMLNISVSEMCTYHGLNERGGLRLVSA